MPIFAENTTWYRTQYKTLLTSKKSEYYDTKITELENSTNNLDQTSFWKCLKSIDDTVKQKDVQLIVSEQNWLCYFQSLYIPINLSIPHGRQLLMS